MEAQEGSDDFEAASGSLTATVRIGSPSNTIRGRAPQDLRLEDPEEYDHERHHEEPVTPVEPVDADESGMKEWRSLLQTSASFMDGQSTAVSRSRSAPMLPAQHSTAASTWHTGASWSSSPSTKYWKPLGSTWRDWDENNSRRGIARDANNKKDFMNGTVPNWQKQGTVRIKHLLQHELAWAYYRTRRHAEHPLRAEVGETLPAKAVVGAMRSGSNIFYFWRDLRPPFDVLEVVRSEHSQELSEPGGRGIRPHPDGELFFVTYECPIEYFAERLWGQKSDGGTFNNKIHGVAQVRIPLDFPEKSHLRVAGWGSPGFMVSPHEDAKVTGVEPPTAVDPLIWMPISEELSLRPDIHRFKACRSESRIASRRADVQRKRGVQVPELQKLLLGPHASLPKLAAAEQKIITGSPDDGRKMIVKPPRTVPPRKHRIFTASSGFVSYAG